jgi:hypothetical protein
MKLSCCTQLRRIAVLMGEERETRSQFDAISAAALSQA